MLKVRLVMQRQLLYSVTQIQQFKVTWTDHTRLRAEQQLASAFQHVDTDAIHERASHLTGAADTNVVT